MKRISILLALAGLLFNVNVYSQRDVTNGLWLAPKGNLRVLIVFVEIDWGDSTASMHKDLSFGAWPNSGQLPAWRNTLYDFTFQTPQVNETSQYFEELSFGEYHVIADYHDSLVTLQLSDFFDTNGMFHPKDNIYLQKVIVDKLSSLTLHTSQGLPVSAFDQWTSNDWYEAKTNVGDGMIDHLMVFIRNYPGKGTQGGWTGDNSYIGTPYTAFGTLVNSYSEFSANNLPFSISRHEYAHGIFGSNTYHTVGKPGGSWMFMWGAGGYSSLSSSGGMKTLTGNAFDRSVVKYKPATNTYQISARAVDGVTELNADLDSFKLDPANPSGEYILRDFWITGDAIRIKLPYTQRSGYAQVPQIRIIGQDPITFETLYDTVYRTFQMTTHNQYLWIENRQSSGSPYSLYSGSDEGMYAYLQVGRDFSDPLYDSYQAPPGLPFDALQDSVFFHTYENRVPQSANYLHFLPAIGKYDYSYVNVNDPDHPNHVRAFLSDAQANPFTGYTHLIQPAWDFNGDSKINKSEGYWIRELTRNGTPLSNTDFVDHEAGASGGIKQFDAFQPVPGRNKLGISHNPAAVPVMTFATYQNDGSYQSMVVADRAIDNKIIDLNNISVEILEQRPNGDIKVKVRFDDYTIEQDVRWCGPIVLHDKVFVDSGATVTLDRGLMPVRNSDPLTINGEKIFSDATSFLMMDNAKFQVQSYGKLDLRNSTQFKITDGILNLEPHSEMEIREGSEVWVEDGHITVKDNATLAIRSGSKVYIQSAGDLEIKTGGKIIVDPGAELIIRSDGVQGHFTVGTYQAPGAPPVTNPAELYVRGTLSFQYIDWKSIDKNGLFHFTAGSTVNIDNGRVVELKGPNKNTKVLQIDWTSLNLDVSSFSIEDGLIEMNSSGKLIIDNANVSLEDVTHSGGAIEVRSPASFTALQYNAQNTQDAIKITNATALAGSVDFSWCEFNNCTSGIIAENVDDLFVSNTDMQLVSTGIKATDCRKVNYHGELYATGNGIDLLRVPGCYVVGSHTMISASRRGILGDEAQVFVRNGATIRDAEVGVELDGENVSGAYTSMLTVGDVGCGALIHNDNFMQNEANGAIYGNDFILNIDANVHAMMRSTNAVQPNSFYDNENNFDICYGDSTLAPITLLAQGNYWASSPLRNYSKICHPNYCRIGEQKSCAYLPVDTTDRSTCTPTNDFCHTCGEKDLSGFSDFTAAIASDFKELYASFTGDGPYGDGDTYENRSSFSSLSMIDLHKSLEEGDPYWYIVHDGENYPIEEVAAHMIQVARVIYGGRIHPDDARMQAETSENVFEEYFKDRQLEVQIIPNPAQYQVKINVKGKDLRKYQLNIYRATGERVFEVPSFIDAVRINTSDLGGMGIYYVEVISLESDERTVEKLMVEK